jgi:hypothetical protein
VQLHNQCNSSDNTNAFILEVVNWYEGKYLHVTIIYTMWPRQEHLSKDVVAHSVRNAGGNLMLNILHEQTAQLVGPLQEHSTHSHNNRHQKPPAMVRIVGELRKGVVAVGYPPCY